MDEFFKYWFQGFENAVNILDKKDSICIFKECGRLCSESYSKKLYIDTYEKSNSINDFFNNLNGEYIHVKVIKENEVYEVAYPECLCDLYTKGYMKTSKLCECSKQSLIYNLETLFKDKYNIKVEKVSTILEGARECAFKISLFSL